MVCYVFDIFKLHKIFISKDWENGNFPSAGMVENCEMLCVKENGIKWFKEQPQKLYLRIEKVKYNLMYRLFCIR